MSFIKEINKESALLYIWVMSTVIITFYAKVSVVFGPFGEYIENIETKNY